MLGGSYYYNADRLKRKEYTDLMKRREAQEKKDAWIRELEARDLEGKEWREKLGQVRDFQREEAVREAMEKEEEEGMKKKGVVGALKGKMKDVQDAEAMKEEAELEQEKALMRLKREEVEKKQKLERMKQDTVKQAAGMGPDTRVWGEDGGGFFGWKRIRALFKGPDDADEGGGGKK